MGRWGGRNSEHAGRRDMALDADWEEGKHPRGQPGNAGQFSSGGGGSTKTEPQHAPIDWTPGGGAKTVKIGDTVIDYGVSRDGKSSEIILVKTPENLRGRGSARTALESFIRSADEDGKTLFLNSDPMGKGVRKSKLDAFYKSLGFVKNMGKNKDFTSRAEFVRQPKNAKSAPG